MIPQPTAGVLARAVAGSGVSCAALVHAAACVEAEAIRGTAQASSAATARVVDGDVFADVVAQEAAETICLLVTVEGAALAEVRLTAPGRDVDTSFPPPGDSGRLAWCERDSILRLTVEELVAEGLEVVVVTRDGRELRGPLERR